MKIAFLILGFALPAAAQETGSFEVDVVVQINALGDAQLEFTIKSSAAHWAEWKKNYGSHPDLLKRDLKRMLPESELSNFEMKQEDMERKATIRCQGKAACRYRGEGHFEIEIPAEMKKVADTGREWHFTRSEIMTPTLVRVETWKIVLPAEAQGMKLGPIAEGKQNLSYDMPVRGGVSGWLLLAGVGILGLLMSTALRIVARQPVAPALEKA